MEKKVRLLIVGGGPAGISAGITLARAGKEVVLIERGSFCGSKNVFGGAIYTKPTKEIFPDFEQSAPLERNNTKHKYMLLTEDEDTTISHSKCNSENSYTVIRGKFDRWMAEQAKNAGVTIEEATVKPTIVTDESTFANKPNKATKPEDEKEPKVKEVSTSEFGAEASEPFHCPSMKCEAIAPKEKIKQIFETAKVRYSKTDKSEWNSLDRRYITKLIENGCGYQRASKIILEAKKR